MATFGDVYRDVYSRLGIDGDSHDIYFDDISKAINDSIRQRRIEYTRNEIATDLSDTETLNSFSESTEYPFLQEDTLSNKILDEVPVEMAVLSSNAYNTSNELLDQTQSFDKGDLVRKGNGLYECLDNISNQNTFDLTFEQRNYKTYYRNNGLSYDIGDVVYDKESGDYFEVNTGFTANQDTEASNVSELDKLYWKRIDDSNIYVSHYPFKNLQELRVIESLGNVAGLSIKGDKIYTTKNVSQVVLSYVPKWTDVSGLDDTINLPDFMLPNIKNDALRILSQKLNLEMQLERKQLGGQEDE